MLKGDLSKEEVVGLVGESAIEAIERENCEPTGRVGYNGKSRNEQLCEWSASISCKDNNDIERTLTAYYYTTNEEDEIINETGDGGSIDWEIEGYELD